MKAVIINKHGGLETLMFKDIPEPKCKPGKVKVNIESSSINHLDLWVRNGLSGINLPFPMVLGSDGAGTIVEIGSDVRDYKMGDQVVIQPGTFCGNCSFCKAGNENYCHQYGVLGETESGVQAEYIVVDPINIYAKANHLTFAESSSMQLVFMTAYQMLIKRANIQKNEIVLIYGGTSGVGSAAIQISCNIGAHVIATVGSRDKVEHAQKMGADNVLIHSYKNWQDDVKDIVGKRGVDIVFEHVGKATWEQSLSLLAKGGRIVTCGATTGQNVPLNLKHLFIKQHTIMGSTMSSLPTFKEVMEKIHNKVYSPFVDKIFKMEDIRKAHAYIEQSKHNGKVAMVFNF